MAEINWSSHPDSRDASTPYKLIRIPARGVFQFYNLSAKVLGVRLHFFKGRTRPHTEGECEACDAGVESRWRGYVAACNKHNLYRGLIELTPGPAQQLIDLTDAGKSIFGQVLSLSRPGGKPNSRIQLDIHPCDRDPATLPECFNVTKTLLKIWQIPAPNDPQSNGQQVTNRLSRQKRIKPKNDHQQS